MAFPFLVQAAIYVAIIILTELLRPKPDLEDAEAAKFEDFGIPSTDPQRTIPVGWGTFRVSGPGIAWYGDYNPQAIEQEVKTGLWSSDTQIIGYNYYIGVQLGFARAVDSFLAIDWDDERLATFSPEIVPGASGTVVSVDEPDFLGGDDGPGANGGGIVGDFRFYEGRSDQTVNAYLSQFQNPISAYRQMAYVVLEGVYIGAQPSIKPIAFVGKRIPERLWISPPSVAYHEIIQDNGIASANPSEVILDLLIDDDYGLGIDISRVDLDSLRAAGVTLYAEKNGYSNVWISKSPVLEIINDVLRQIDGLLFLDFDTGLFTLTLARSPFGSPPTAPPVFNESNLVEVEDFTRGNWTETTNRVIVNWNDPYLPKNPSPAIQDDMANQRIQNRNVATTFNMKGVADPLQAAQIAAREIRGLSFPLAKCTLVANRDAITLRPADVFDLSWDDLGIVSMRMRVTSVALGGSEEIRVRITALQDVFSLGDVVYAQPAPTSWSNPSLPPPVATLADACFEAPLYMDRLSPLTSPVVADSEQDSRIVLAPVAAQQNVTGFRMMQNGGVLSPSTPDFIVADFANMCASGLLAVPIAQDQFLNPSSPNTITISDGVALGLLQNASEADIESLLSNLMLIDDELISYETRAINSDGTVTLSNIHRAKLDTVPAVHGYGARVYFLASGSFFSGGITNDRFSVAGSVGARPITTKGILPTESLNACTFTPANRVFRPYRPANVQVAVVGSPDIAASYFPASLPRALWRITWDIRDRTELSDIDVNENTSQARETNTEVVIQFRQAGSPAVLREVITGAAVETYDYTVAQQDADYGGPGSPGFSPAEQPIEIRVFSRRSSGPLSGLESFGAWQWTVTRTGVT